jgi:hypothetical protein
MSQIQLGYHANWSSKNELLAEFFGCPSRGFSGHHGLIFAIINCYPRLFVYFSIGSSVISMALWIIMN